MDNTIHAEKIKHRNDLSAPKKTDPDNEYLKSAYNRFRNSVNRDIKTNKQEHYQYYFDKCQNNMNKMWKGINELISSKSKSPISISKIKTNDILIDDPTKIVNSFNDFLLM